MKQIANWKCANGHDLGQVVRNGKSIRQLLIYRQAVDPQAEHPAEIDVLGVAEGLVMEVRCSVCGSERTWMPGEEALKRLIEKRGAWK
jgi:hypothetical protein